MDFVNNASKKVQSNWARNVCDEDDEVKKKVKKIPSLSGNKATKVGKDRSSVMTNRKVVTTSESVSVDSDVSLTPPGDHTLSWTKKSPSGQRSQSDKQD